MIDLEYLKTLSDDEKIEECSHHLEEIKNENNIKEVYDTLRFMLDSLISNARFPEAISIVEEAFKNYEFSLDQKVKLLDYEITSYFKCEQFNELLEVLNKKKKIVFEDSRQLSNVKFYEAISYEALDEPKKAIESLESIVDNISATSLTNKYIKLSMLYLKVKEFNKAKNAYDYACQIDYAHRNDMFLLLESDLHYYSGNYEEALFSFEAFFLKSPNKYKYIDRYIYINIKLGSLDDAYQFYKRYENEPSIKLSSQNRYSFYKAAYELLLVLKKEDEYDKVRGYLESVKPLYFNGIEEERNKVIETITKSLSYPLTKNDKPKNIAHRFFKLIKNYDSGYKAFVEVFDNDILFHTEKGDRISEKAISRYSLAEKEILDEYILKEEMVKPFIFDENIDQRVGNYLILPLKTEYKYYGYLIFETAKDDHLVFRVLRDSIIYSFTYLDTIIKTSKVSNSIIDSFEKDEMGYIRITKDSVEFYDRETRINLGLKKQIISYDDFKSIMEEDETDFSSFENIKEKDLHFKVLDNRYVYRFNFNRIGDEIFAITKNMNSSLSLEEKKNAYFTNDGLKFKNRNQFEEIILNKENINYAIVGLYIKIIEEGDSLSVRDEKLNQLFNYLTQITPSSELYYFGENHFIILNNSIDKRVLSSIYSNVIASIRSLYRYSFSLRDTKITGFASKALKNKDLKEIFELIEYGFSFSNHKQDFIILDNEEKKKYSLYKTYENEVSRRVKDERFNLEFLPIIDEDNAKIKYFFAYLKMPLDIDHETFENILTTKHLESKADSVMIKTLFSKMTELNPGLRFVIPIHKESILNTNFIKQISLLFKEYKLNNRITFSVMNYEINDYQKGLASLSNAGIKLATTINDLKDIKDANKFNMIFINYEQGNDFYNDIVNHLISTYRIDAVVLRGKHLIGTLSMRDVYKVHSFDDLKKY